MENDKYITVNGIVLVGPDAVLDDITFFDDHIETQWIMCDEGQVFGLAVGEQTFISVTNNHQVYKSGDRLSIDWPFTRMPDEEGA